MRVCACVRVCERACVCVRVCSGGEKLRERESEQEERDWKDEK